MSSLSALQIRHRYLALVGLRWLAAGLVIPIQVLLPLSRGLSLAEVGLVFSAQGFVVLLLELPTGALSDSWGRKPVMLVAAAVGFASSTLFFFAHSPAAFALAAALTGLYRALDSGPLEAWYVDATHAVEPDQDIQGGLAAGNTVIGVAIAVGSLLAGGLVAWHPIASVEQLALPVLACMVIQLLMVPAAIGLMTDLRDEGERPGVWVGVRGVPNAIGSGLGLLRRSRVLLGIVLVEMFWGFGMPGFESLTPVRLAEILNDQTTAAALMGPVGSIVWIASAVGSASGVLVSRRFGVARTAAAMRLMQGAAVVVMGLVAGPIGLLTAFLANYLVHGASNSLHSVLLHKQVGAENRATVVSINNMISQGAGALGTLVLPLIAQASSVQFAIVVAGVVLALAAPLYLPARATENLR